MAGMRTVEELLKIAPDIYDITVFGDEPYPNYNRIMLSPVLANEQTIDDIILNTREWYAEHNIMLYTSAVSYTHLAKLMDGVVWDGKDPAAYAAGFKIKA